MSRTMTKDKTYLSYFPYDITNPFPVLGGFWVNIRCNCWFCNSFFVCTTKERNTQEKRTNSVVGKINNLKKQEGKKITKVQGLY